MRYEIHPIFAITARPRETKHNYNGIEQCFIIDEQMCRKKHVRQAVSELIATNLHIRSTKNSNRADHSKA
jgi:hypothetical protein